MTLLDPIFVNPNSIENMILVLRHIGQKAHIAKYLRGCREQLHVNLSDQIVDFHLL